MLDLEFRLPGSGVSLEAAGRVVWLPDKDIQAHSYPGMGVAFIHPTSETERAIIDFIDKNITYRSEPA
jgi:hypothetical protein